MKKMNDFPHRFSDAELQKQALTHRSFGRPHNERLEWLGDAVLEMTLSEILYRRFPQKDEGELTFLRSRLVSDKSLADAARRLNLGDCIRLGRSEMCGGGRLKGSILAGALESLIGATLLDGGIESARKTVGELFESVLADDEFVIAPKDPKSQLQEKMQAAGLRAPTYHLEKKSGEDHLPHFEVSCRINGDEVARAEGANLREAEMRAATLALAREEE